MMIAETNLTTRKNSSNRDLTLLCNVNNISNLLGWCTFAVSTFNTLGEQNEARCCCHNVTMCLPKSNNNSVFGCAGCYVFSCLCVALGFILEFSKLCQECSASPVQFLAAFDPKSGHIERFGSWNCYLQCADPLLSPKRLPCWLLRFCVSFCVNSETPRTHERLMCASTPLALQEIIPEMKKKGEQHVILVLS